MSQEKLTPVMVYLMTHRDVVQSDYFPVARLDMGMLPTKGDMIDVADHILSDGVFPNMHRHFDPDDQVLRVDSVYIAYRTDGHNEREVVSICGTPVPRPNFM